MATARRIARRFIDESYPQLREWSKTHDYLDFMDDSRLLYEQWREQNAYPQLSYDKADIDAALMSDKLYEQLLLESGVSRINVKLKTRNCTCFTGCRWKNTAAVNKSITSKIKAELDSYNRHDLLDITMIKGFLHIHKFDDKGKITEDWAWLEENTENFEETLKTRPVVQRDDEGEPIALRFTETSFFVADRHIGESAGIRKLGLSFGERYDQDSVLMKEVGRRDIYLVGTSKRKDAWPGWLKEDSLGDYMKRITRGEVSAFHDYYSHIKGGQFMDAAESRNYKMAMQWQKAMNWVYDKTGVPVGPLAARHKREGTRRK